MLDAIGRTPLMRLHHVVPPGSADVVIKLEYFNPTGSYKDRMALAMIEGYHFHPLSSDAFAKEKLDTMRAFGADLEIVQSDGGKVTPALFDRFKARIAELMKDPNNFWTDQFNNPDALDGYANIGHELVEQTEEFLRIPRHHGDPFDRMLVAQARVEGAKIVTHDRAFEAYGIPVIWT